MRLLFTVNAPYNILNHAWSALILALRHWRECAVTFLVHSHGTNCYLQCYINDIFHCMRSSRLRALLQALKNAAEIHLERDEMRRRGGKPGLYESSPASLPGRRDCLSLLRMTKTSGRNLKLLLKNLNLKILKDRLTAFLEISKPLGRKTDPVWINIAQTQHWVNFTQYQWHIYMFFFNLYIWPSVPQ